MKKHMFILGLLVVTVFRLSAQKSEVFISKSGIAINGYDPVAYFKESKPVLGNEKFNYKWNDASWLFSNQQNLDSFKLDPVKYAPQFGGYCAYGMSKGHKAPTEPDTFTIVEGKLYLNYDLKVKEMWSKDREKKIADANNKWPLLKDKE